MPDADIDSAVNALTGAAFGSAGERCMAISVAVAVGDIADNLAEKLADKTRNLKIGNGTEKGLDMGPLISSWHPVTPSLPVEEAGTRMRLYGDLGRL